MKKEYDAISVVIVDYKGLSITIKFIKQFGEILLRNIENINFIVVENSQEVLLREIISSNYNDIIELSYNSKKIRNVYEVKDLYNIFFIMSNVNGGYAQGNNLGAQFCYNNHLSEMIIFSNNDIVVPNGFRIEKLISDLYKEHGIAAVGPKVIGKDCIQQGPYRKMGFINGYVLKYINWKLINDFTSELAKNKKDIYWVSGCFFLVDIYKFMEVGMFDEKTFLYCEEMILAEKFSRKGYTFAYDDNVEVIHLGAETISNNVASKKMIEYELFSRAYYFREYRRIPTWFINIVMKLLSVILELKYGK